MTNIRLPDPLSIPGAPGFTVVRMNDNNPMFRERLPGTKVLTIQSAAQYWGITLSYEELTPDEYNLILGCLLKAKQFGYLIEVILPHKEKYNVIGNTSSVIIPAAQQGSTLTMQNYSLTGIPKVGDIIKLSNHCSKVYTVHGASLLGSTLTLNIYPNLMKATTGTEKPIFNNVLFQLALENPSELTNSFTSDGVYSSFQVELAESVTYDN